MEFELLGTESTGPTLELDHERFAYAGKFVMSNTGKTVVRDGGALVGATAFSTDYSDSSRARIRYVTVREDRRGERIGPQLLRFTANRLSEQFEAVAIAVNNPVAYQACYRAGFVWTGEETGIAELLLRYAPGEANKNRYRAGFELFAERDLPPTQRRLVDCRETAEPPTLVEIE